jgi:membrane protease YdiL (CAAX protease family)
MNHPLVLILMTGVGAYCAWLWFTDLRANRDRPPPIDPLVATGGRLPGAEPAPIRSVGIAVAGVTLILAFETWGESILGLTAEQSKMTVLFALYSVVAAPVIEEIIFRGYLVVTNRRRAVVWAGAIGASAVFAALHPFLWRWDDAGFVWTINAKGVFSTAVLFATSLWLYAARLAAWNPQGSLLPCFIAHAAKNLGVVVIKGATGFISGWW